MPYLRLLVCALWLSVLTVASQAQSQYDEGPRPELNSQVDILGVVKAENGWDGGTDRQVLDGGWTGALKTFPLAIDTLEFRLLFAPTGKRPDWWGQTDVGGPGHDPIPPQQAVQNPALQASVNGKDFASMPLLTAQVRGPAWDEGLGLYSATIYVAPQVKNKTFWPQRYRRLRFSGQIPDLFSKPECPIGLPFDIEFSTQKDGKSERWVANMRNRGPQYFLKSIRIDKVNPRSTFPAIPKGNYKYELVSTLVGIWPTDIFTYYTDSPPALNAEGKRVYFSSDALTTANGMDHKFNYQQPQPNMPIFVTRHIVIGQEPLDDKENSAMYFRSHLGWDQSPTVLYPFKLDGKILLGDLPSSQWKFEEFPPK